MGSLTNAFFMLGGPISSSFIQRFGCRSSLILGSVLIMTGYIASAFTTSLEMLFFTYGIVIGNEPLGRRSWPRGPDSTRCSPCPFVRFFATAVLYMWNRHDY
ncbi:hypothetical protein C7M84_015112 [Penaeus vannamei]|uniref:Major facilitator superfamily (MFS) profile domain-containing protein n=1 Tax=Penaeus vannamei TaxID=6689 RepID=A0A3R7NU88_PENVA|nr:hypothetical protein C7M84_015112 [Penaeus vannamei]